MGFIKSFGYAARGVWYCIRHERNFRIHLGIAAYVLAFAPYFSLSRAEWAVLAVLMALVLCAEAVNTAVERTVDLASTERQPRARACKGCPRRGPSCFAPWRQPWWESCFSPVPISGGRSSRTFSRSPIKSRCWSSPSPWCCGLSSAAAPGTSSEGLRGFRWLP